MPPKLKIYDDQGHRSVDLVYDRVSFGRDSSCTVQIRDTMASREHCRIEKSGGEFKLVDLASRNGTKVNGSLVSEHKLNHGDEVTIGEVVIRFEHPEGSSGKTKGATGKAPASGSGHKRPSSIEKSTRRVPRAKKSGGGNELIVFGGVACVGLLLALLIIAATGGGSSKSAATKWLRKATAAIESGDYVAADEYLEKAERARNKEPEEIAAIKAARKDLEKAQSRDGDRQTAAEAMNAYKVALNKIKSQSLEGPAAISELEGVRRRYPGTEAARLAGAEVSKLRGGAGVDEKTAVDTQVKALLAQQEFENAHRILFKFWEKTGDTEAEAQLTEIIDKGNDAYAKIKQQADIAVAAENKDRARELYQRVKRKFGNPWANRADEELSKLD